MGGRGPLPFLTVQMRSKFLLQLVRVPLLCIFLLPKRFGKASLPRLENLQFISLVVVFYIDNPPGVERLRKRRERVLPAVLPAA